jgi:hypothetical protein
MIIGLLNSHDKVFTGLCNIVVSRKSVRGGRYILDGPDIPKARRAENTFFDADKVKSTEKTEIRPEVSRIDKPYLNLVWVVSPSCMVRWDAKKS